MKTNNKLPTSTIARIRPLEQRLLTAVRAGATERAIETATEIQALYGSDRRHPRLLRAKLWMFESCLDSQRLTYAEAGLIGIRKLASPRTRLYLEASSLLAVCYLRQRKVADAKRLIREVIKNINNISSDRTRHAFQRRLIERVEEECILVELIGTGDDSLDPEDIHGKAVLLLQNSTDDEIFRLIGNSLPVAGVRLLTDVRDYSIKQLPEPDQQLLPGPPQSRQSKHLGKMAFALLRRVAWKTLCDADSPIFALWSKRVPEIFNRSYFAAAIAASMSSLRIGVPLLASGVVALVMKYSAQEFCEIAKPKGIMMKPNEYND
jgi:hypothetical protein